MAGDLARMVGSILVRHSELQYSTEVGGAHVGRFDVPVDVLDDEYCDIWRTYNDALFNSLRWYVRYLRSLLAWREIERGIDEKYRATVIADYAFPVFRFACDIPVTFKDQAYCGAVKLACFAQEGAEVDSTDYAKGRARPKWHKDLQELAKGNPATSEFCDLLQRELFQSVEAQHFIDLHGLFMHDVSPSLMEGQLATAEDAIGGLLVCEEGPLRLSEEIPYMESHLCALAKTYEAFNVFAGQHYRELPMS